MTIHISVVMDRSGSMGPLTDDTIGGFNAWLKQVKKANQDEIALLTLHQFDNEHLFPYENAVLESVKPLNRKTYIPRGSTALRDAFAMQLERLAPLVGKSDKAIVVVITDGYENASHRYTPEQLKKLIRKAEKQKNWSLTYLGANQDAVATGAALGMTDRSGRVSTQASGAGAQALYNSVGSTMSAQMAGSRHMHVNTTQIEYDKELADQVEAAKKKEKTT